MPEQTSSPTLTRWSEGKTNQGVGHSTAELNSKVSYILNGERQKAAHGIATLREDLAKVEIDKINANVRALVDETMTSLTARATEAEAQRPFWELGAILRDAATDLDGAKAGALRGRMRDTSLEGLLGFARSAVANKDLGVLGLLSEELDNRTEPASREAVKAIRAMLTSVPLPGRDQVIANLNTIKARWLEGRLVVAEWTGKATPILRLQLAREGLTERITKAIEPGRGVSEPAASNTDGMAALKAARPEFSHSGSTSNADIR